MPDVMMQLGNFQFSIQSAAYQDLHRSVDYRWAEMQRISHRPSLQFVGIGNDEIELRGVILPTFQGGIHQVDILRTYAQKGKPQTLATGRGENWGPWCVRSITDEQSTMTFKGTPLKIEFTVRLSYYGPDDESLGAKGYVSSTWANLLGKQGTTLITPPALSSALPGTLPPVKASQLTSIAPALTAAKIPPQQAASTLTKAVQALKTVTTDVTKATAILAQVALTVSSVRRGIVADPVGTVTGLATSALGQTGLTALFGPTLAGQVMQIGAAVSLTKQTTQTVGNLLVTTARTVH
jgi:phage protein U